MTLASTNPQFIHSCAGILRGSPPTIQPDDMIDPWSGLGQAMLEAPAGQRLAALDQFLASHPDAVEIRRALFAIDPNAPLPESASRSRFRLLTLAELEELPPPEWLVEGLFVAGSLAVLYGPEGTFKSFVALDLVLSVAAGLAWQGHAVRPGYAVYVGGEGGPGLGMRAKAWRVVRGAKVVERFRAITEAVQVAQADDLDALLRELAVLPEPPAFIVVDTLARSFVGHDENSAKDIGVFVAAVDRLRRETGATILLVHHVARAGNIRGSTALPGALDTAIEAKRDGDVLTLECTKQKDAEPFAPIRLAQHVVELGDNQSSLILNLTDRAAAARLSESTRKVLAILRDKFDADGATATEWQRLAIEAGISNGSFYEAKKTLAEQGAVEKLGTGARGARFRAVAQ
jgi:RecA-family ATPase